MSANRRVGSLGVHDIRPAYGPASDSIIGLGFRVGPVCLSPRMMPCGAGSAAVFEEDWNRDPGNEIPEPTPVDPGKKQPKPAPKTKKVTLVELVEVVARSPEGVVAGAGGSSAKMKTTVTRGDRNGGAYKQYINVGKDIEGAAKRHPEYSRQIDFKARVTCDGVGLSGHTVKFGYELTAGSKRPAKLAGDAIEGYSGAKTTTAKTDGEGWTDTVRFTVSRYAGDRFAITAEAEEDAGNVKKTGLYEVWRKFWYQISRSETQAVPAPGASITAYAKVFADMLATEEVHYTEATAPANSFYPGFMVRMGGGDAKESVIGGHNREGFYKLFKDDAATPVKGHLIICQHQWDPGGTSELLTATVTKNPSDELQLNLDGAFNSGILKPALSGALVAVGSWSGGGKSGTLTEANILIEKSRSALKAFKVSLPADAPDPATTPVQVKLKLAYGKFFAGESNKNQMLIVYRGQAANYTQVVAHEFGHGFGQTPREGTQPPPLPKHPKQYSNEHGGVGSHCSTDATLVDDPLYPLKRYKDGTCIMFHQVNPGGCKQLFCGDCEPYLRLRDFSTLS